MSALTADAARRVLDSALEQAARDELRVGGVVVDAGGHVVASQRMDGAYLSSLAIAERKAFTALNFRTTTAIMCERLPDRGYQAVIAAADARLAFLPGGAPLYDSAGTLIGALGISGASADQDAAISTLAAQVSAEA